MNTNETYIKAFNFLLRNEGGYVDDPDDSGGATKYGISLIFLSNIYKKGTLWADINKDGKVDKNDIVLLNIEIAKKIYEQAFWLKVKMIPYTNLAIKVFDAGVNIGMKKAIQLLQRILSVAEDGIIGPITLEAIKKFNKNMLMEKYIEALCGYYYTITYCNRPRFDKFIKGWLNRAKKRP